MAGAAGAGATIVVVEGMVVVGMCIVVRIGVAVAVQSDTCASDGVAVAVMD